MLQPFQQNWEQLPAERHQRFMELPPERRDMLRKRYQWFQQLPTEKRQACVINGRPCLRKSVKRFGKSVASDWNSARQNRSSVRVSGRSHRPGVDGRYQPSAAFGVPSHGLHVLPCMTDIMQREQFLRRLMLFEQRIPRTTVRMQPAPRQSDRTCTRLFLPGMRNLPGNQLRQEVDVYTVLLSRSRGVASLLIVASLLLAAAD